MRDARLKTVDKRADDLAASSYGACQRLDPKINVGSAIAICAAAGSHAFLQLNIERVLLMLWKP